MEKKRRKILSIVPGSIRQNRKKVPDLNKNNPADDVG